MEMMSSTISLRNFILISLVVLSFFFISTLPPKHSNNMFHDKMSEEKDELQTALAKTEINKTVIIAMVNKAHVEGDPAVNMLDLFLESFWLGDQTRPLIRNLLIVATDRTAYDRCLFRGLHCYWLDNYSDGSDSPQESVFISELFINLMWRRTFFLLTVLRRGYNFILTDPEVMWLRNPFKILNANNTNSIVDIQFSTNRFNGNPRSESNSINSGFYYVRSTNGTIALFDKWYAEKENANGTKEQDVLEQLLRGGVLRELNVTASFLETRYFSGFCQDNKEINKVVTVHANCCRYIHAKLENLARVLQDWKRFKLGSKPLWSRHKNCLMSWKTKNSRNTQRH